MHQTGYDKVTSQCPCAPYLMRMVADPETKGNSSRNAQRSVMVPEFESETVKFNVPMLCHNGLLVL